jgi:hypothetical protein
VLERVPLIHGQSVHVGPEANARAATFRQRTYNTSFSQPSIDFHSPTLQAFGYQPGGPFLLVSEFWVGMNVPPQMNHFIFVGFNF